MYGKFQGFSQFIFHYDIFVLGGVGALSTRPIPVIDPDNRKFDWNWKFPAFTLGIGLRIALNRWFTVTAAISDQIPTSSSSRTRSPADAGRRSRTPATWIGQKPLTNNIQTQLGISVFLPFSWEYKLPK